MVKDLSKEWRSISSIARAEDTTFKTVLKGFERADVPVYRFGEKALFVKVSDLEALRASGFKFRERRVAA